MDKLSQSQTVGLMVMLAIIIGIVSVTAIKAMFSAANYSGIALREAFPQASATPSVASPSGSLQSTSSPVTAGTHTDESRTAAPSNPGVGSNTDSQEIVVHVAGAVHKPGVYHLPLTA